MTSPYVAATFTGGIPSGTALTNAFADVKVALDQCLQRLETVGNGMEEDLDMNGHRLLNVLKGVDPSDVATLENIADSLGTGNSTAIADLQTGFAQLGIDVTALETAVTNLQTLSASNQSLISAINSRSLEDRVVAVVASTAGGSFPGRLDTASAGDDNQISKILLHDWINIYWTTSDPSSSAIFGPGSIPRLNFTDTVTSTGESYNLYDSDGSALGENTFEPGDTLRGNVWVKATGGAAGSIRLHRQASIASQASIDAVATDVVGLDTRLQTVESQLPDDDTALSSAIAANLATITSEMADQDTLEAQVTTLSGTVSSNTAGVNTNASGLANEISTRAAADTALQTSITANANAHANLASVVSTIQTDVGDLQVKQVVFPFTYDPIADGTEVVHFTVSEAFLLTNAGASHAVARVAPPSAAAQWNILRNGVVVGTADWLLGDTVGTITGYTAVAPVTYAIGDVFSVEATTNNGIEAVSLTLLFQEAP